MKTLNLYKYGKNYPMTFKLDRYTDNGNLYVGLITHVDGYPEPWQNLTVNLGKCMEGYAYIDTNNNGEEILRWLFENGIGHLTGAVRQSGFCLYPEFEFNLDKLAEYTSSGLSELKGMWWRNEN